MYCIFPPVIVTLEIVVSAFSPPPYTFWTVPPCISTLDIFVVPPWLFPPYILFAFPDSI